MLKCRIVLFLCGLFGAAGFPVATFAQREASTSNEANPTGEAMAASVAVEGFSARFDPIATPEAQWADGSAQTWLQAFRGELLTEKVLAYRGGVLPTGRHQMWVEKGKGEWFHFFIGNKEDSNQPRLKALFRLYELEKGVEALRLELKLTGRKTKLKFSIFVGRNEGHGNLRILDDGGDVEPTGTETGEADEKTVDEKTVEKEAVDKKTVRRSTGG